MAWSGEELEAGEAFINESMHAITSRALEMGLAGDEVVQAVEEYAVKLRKEFGIPSMKSCWLDEQAAKRAERHSRGTHRPRNQHRRTGA